MLNDLAKVKKIVKKIESYDYAYSSMSDVALSRKTDEFKKRIKRGESLDSILPEAFAACREAAWRTLHIKHFPVQLMGGVLLHKGMIAEMKTGEGKTLVATTAVYLNALTEKGVHVVTVNDYLAKRDMEQMRKVYNFLGLSVGCILQDMDISEKKAAYNADITYGTNNEFGFDYLRDNMAMSKDKVNQRELNFAIIDEIDSILIDEARTPLIISSQGNDNMEMFREADSFVKSLTKGRDPEEKTRLADMIDEINESFSEDDGDFIVDEKRHSVILTKQGVEKAEMHFNIKNLSDPSQLMLSGYIQQSLKANYLMKKDKDYIIKDGKIAIIDDFTGRLMENRRYSDGLHQAIEAKEGVEINRESKTQATITLQNYFRMYNKISGMTGTALTEAHEFKNIYKLKVVAVPTNKPVLREDLPDRIFMSASEKYNAVTKKTKELHDKGQPVLIGTESVDKSEKLSRMFKKQGISHNVLNAKYHEQEAMIIAQAGKPGAVTIATNMAGRGTDILLGGNPECLAKQEMKESGYSEDVIEAACGFEKIDLPELVYAREVFHKLIEEKKKETDKNKEIVMRMGGLYIIGTDKHESRRIDNQLRGRAGRQGDPGTSCFYVSMEDDITRLFGGSKVKNLLNENGTDSVSMSNKLLSGLIESSQRKIEMQNFETRKSTLEYDDVNNMQRNEIYRLRREVLFSDNLDELVDKILCDTAKLLSEKFLHNTDPAAGVKSLKEFMSGFITEKQDTINLSSDKKECQSDLNALFHDLCAKKIKEFTEILNKPNTEFYRKTLLTVIDKYWVDYITSMITLKDYVSAAAYGSMKPIELYKLQALSMFNELLDNIKIETVRYMINADVIPAKEKITEVNMKKDNEILNNGIPKPKSNMVKKPYVPRNPVLEKRNEFLSRQNKTAET